MLIALLNDATNAEDASTAANAAASAGEVLNVAALDDATESDTRAATRESCLGLLETIAAKKGGSSNGGEASLVANAVRALIAKPAETTAGALTIAARLLQTTIDEVVRRRLPLRDDELRSFAMAFEAGLAVAATRMHPNETAASQEASRLKDVPIELASGEVNASVNPYADDPAAPKLARGYALYSPIAATLIEGARVLALKAMRVGLPPRLKLDAPQPPTPTDAILPEYMPGARALEQQQPQPQRPVPNGDTKRRQLLGKILSTEQRSIGARTDSMGLHSLWNTSCDPIFRRSIFGAAGDLINLVVPSSER